MTRPPRFRYDEDEWREQVEALKTRYLGQEITETLFRAKLFDLGYSHTEVHSEVAHLNELRSKK